MKLGETVGVIPTIGFNVESVLYSKIDFTIWVSNLFGVCR